MKNALIISDYGKNTGIGHLTRCSSLAKELTGDLCVKFACPSGEGYRFITEFACDRGFETEDVSELTNAAAYAGADLIIVDSYKATTKFLTDIKNICEVCVVIDDNCTLPFYDADFVLNQNIGADGFAYGAKIRKDTELLLGPDYIMLRDTFRGRSPINVSGASNRVVITMGGADLKNITEKVLKLVEKRREYVFDVVVGPDFGEREELLEYAESAENIVLINNADMPELFSGCRGAVSACGSTVYELAFMGVPTIGVVTAENQQNVSIAMDNEGIIASAGLCEKLSEAYFGELFYDVMENTVFRENMHNKQINTIKLDGAKRIKERIIKRLGL